MKSIVICFNTYPYTFLNGKYITMPQTSCKVLLLSVTNKKKVVSYPFPMIIAIFSGIFWRWIVDDYIFIFRDLLAMTSKKVRNGSFYYKYEFEQYIHIHSACSRST